MKIPQLRTVPEIVKQFYSVISQPVRYASLFYTYYYLVEVENIRELRRDFEKIRDELWLAFNNYGIYSVGIEMMHLFDRFNILDPETGDAYPYPDWSERRKDWQWIENRLLTSLIVDHKVPRRDAILMTKIYDDYLKLWTEYETYYEDVEKACLRFENDFRAFTKPVEFLTVSKMFFDLPAMKKGFMEPINRTFGWLPEYGGEPWAKICKTLLRRRTTKPTIFVDACWNIQHNTGIWMNKVDVSTGELPISSGALEIVLSNNEFVFPRVFNKAIEYEPELIKYKDIIK